jgi:conjugative relaxase-like TrwC/TraI family protein
MRVTTLKVGRSADGMVAYYAGLARDHQRRDGQARGPVDYYLDRQEPPGRWWGTGCGHLQLEGDVRAEQLEALLVGVDPRFGRRLGRAFGAKSARGFDATFSAPKSMSSLWAVTDDPWVRAELLAAHDTAVTAALAWFEQHGAVTRRGTDGVHQVDTRGITAALFRQHTSRTLDPQIHTHAVILAKVQDPSGRWLSLDARFLKQQQRSISYVYAAALRSEVTNRLGLGWGPVDNGHAELMVVPDAVQRLFSQRAEQVNEKLAELIREWSADHDGAEPHPRIVSGLAKAAALRSRPAKDHAVDADDLRGEWQAQAQEVGFDASRVVIGAHPAAPVAWEPDTVITEAIKRVSAAGATWLEADLVREIAALLPPDPAQGGKKLVERVDELAAQAVDCCLPLHPPAAINVAKRRDGSAITEHVTDRRYTTTEVLRQEERLVAWAATATSPTRDDADAVVAAVAGPDRLVLVVGPAGAGKTTTVARAVQQLRQNGRPVLGLAPSGKAADVLANETSLTTATVAKLLTEYRRPDGPSPTYRLPHGTTVVVDEAGMVATDDLAALVSIADRHGWRLVCVGDPDQLPAVGRGGMFGHWCDALPAYHLDEVRRFSQPWEADASLALRHGDPRAVSAYHDHGRLRANHPALVPRQVAHYYEKVTDDGETIAITTASTATARAINQEIQWQRTPQRRGRSAKLADDTRAFAGDQIATRRNDNTLITDRGVTVKNRHTWTVAQVHTDGSLLLTSAEKGTVTLPIRYVREHVELGWAVTGYGNQGVTTDRAVCVIEASSSRAGIYVGMTRGRHANLGLIVDATGALDAREAFTAAISRPPNALTALATREWLYRAQGQPAPAKHQSLPELDETARRIASLQSAAPRRRGRHR